MVVFLPRTCQIVSSLVSTGRSLLRGIQSLGLFKAFSTPPMADLLFRAARNNMATRNCRPMSYFATCQMVNALPRSMTSRTSAK